MRYIKRHKFTTIFIIILSVYLYLNYTRIIEVNPKIDENSPAYINDIYMSDERIYNNYLNENEKKAYNEIKDMFQKREEKRTIDLLKYPGMTPGDISAALSKGIDAVLLDHPEMLQLSGAGAASSNTEVRARVVFAINKPIIESFNTLKIRRIIDDIRKETEDMDDYDKIKYVYEWIGENAYYDYAYTYTSKNQSIYNVFIKGNAVCAGFAKASQVIFQNIGIESITVVGTSTERHMWNIIKLNDKYYYYDSTVAACIRDKEHPQFYDGLKQEEMNYYTKEHPEWYPEIETTTGLIK